MKNATQIKTLTKECESELISLRTLSAQLGKHPLLVQANNGNTSIKLDGVLWIKASGKWLADAMDDELFVPIRLDEATACIERNIDLASRFEQADTMRPSIETPMHATLGHRVVIHVHSINTIAWAIRLDGCDQLKERLADLRWKWVPYAASGIPLAREIGKAAAEAPESDVFVLANHGLVVCGHDCQSAEKLLCEVERRLAITPRRFPKPDQDALETIARLPNWQFPENPAVHALGTDAVSREILKGGILYPCQAIFLGDTMPVVTGAAVASKFADILTDKARTPSFVVVERCGVMLHDSLSEMARAMLVGLAQVIQRTRDSTQIRYLERAEVRDVLSKNAYGYKAAPETRKRMESADLGKTTKQARAATA